MLGIIEWGLLAHDFMALAEPLILKDVAAGVPSQSACSAQVASKVLMHSHRFPCGLKSGPAVGVVKV